MTLSLDALREEDWPAGRAIHREGLATGHSSFETDSPPWASFDAAHLGSCRLAAREDGLLVGWAVLSPTSSRCVYGGVAEVSLYVAASARGRGVGRKLLAALVLASEAEGIWTLQAGIFPENVASLAVHRACGFRILGVRSRLGRMAGVWRDIVFLERRSTVVGLDDDTVRAGA